MFHGQETACVYVLCSMQVTFLLQAQVVYLSSINTCAFPFTLIHQSLITVAFAFTYKWWTQLVEFFITLRIESIMLKIVNSFHIQ